MLCLISYFQANFIVLFKQKNITAYLYVEIWTDSLVDFSVWFALVLLGFTAYQPLKVM